jgi:hypothetical protein
MPNMMMLEALAEALEASAAALRRRLALVEAGESAEFAREDLGAVARARAFHEQLGHRQAQILEVLEQAGPGGTDTGKIARAIDYDQTNVYITLRVLCGLGFAEKDETTRPHTYRLGSLLRP